MKYMYIIIAAVALQGGMMQALTQAPKKHKTVSGKKTTSKPKPQKVAWYTQCPEKLQYDITGTLRGQKGVTLIGFDLSNKTNKDLYYSIDSVNKEGKTTYQGDIEKIPAQGILKLSTPHVEREWDIKEETRISFFESLGDRKNLKPTHIFYIRPGKTIYIKWLGDEEGGLQPQEGPSEGACGVTQEGYDLSINVEQEDIEASELQFRNKLFKKSKKK